jgi:hypothetical protein
MSGSLDPGEVHLLALLMTAPLSAAETQDEETGFQQGLRPILRTTKVTPNIMEKGR